MTRTKTARTTTVVARSVFLGVCVVAAAMVGTTLAPLLSAGRAGAPSSAAQRSEKELEPGLEQAVFAGGCFWCMEPPFDKLDGVVATISGYTGGSEENPTYKQVSAGATGHTEAIRVVFDPAKVGYQKLLEVFWRNHDPLTANRQFCDSGRQYRPGIFYDGEEQRRLAEGSKEYWSSSGRFERPIVTEVTELTGFTSAEDYHQDYYKKNPLRYKIYRKGCGRDRRLDALWGESRRGES